MSFSYWSLFLSFLDGFFYADENSIFVIPIMDGENICGYIYIRFHSPDECYSVSYLYLYDDSFDGNYDSIVYPADIFYKHSMVTMSDLMSADGLRGYLDTFLLDYKKLFLSRFELPFYHFTI